MANIGWGVMITIPGTGAAFEILEVSGPNISRDSVEVTHSKSPNKWREFIAGLKDAGEATVTVHMDPSQAPPINGPKAVCAITFPPFNDGGSPETWTCEAFVTSVNNGTPIDDRMTQDIGLKFSGEWDFG